jgi:hypothetical protein
MAEVLAEKIAQGQYTTDDALAITRALLYDTPQSLCRMTPTPGQLKA